MRKESSPKSEKYIKTHPKTGVVGGNLYSPDMKAVPSYCMQFDDLNTERKRASWRAILIGKISQKAVAGKKKRRFEEDMKTLPIFSRFLPILAIP